MKGAIRYLADDQLRLEGPTDESDPNSPTAITGATCAGKLYDERRSSRVVAAVAAGIAVVPVRDAGVFVTGATVMVRLDNGAEHESSVLSIDTVADEVTLVDAVPAGQSVPAPFVDGNGSVIYSSTLRTKLGADVVMSEYGTPLPNNFDWGYAGTVEQDHTGLLPRMNVRVEVTLISGAVQLFKVGSLIVIEED